MKSGASLRRKNLICVSLISRTTPRRIGFKDRLDSGYRRPPLSLGAWFRNAERGAPNTPSFPRKAGIQP